MRERKREKKKTKGGKRRKGRESIKYKPTYPFGVAHFGSKTKRPLLTYRLLKPSRYGPPFYTIGSTNRPRSRFARLATPPARLSLSRSRPKEHGRTVGVCFCALLCSFFSSSLTHRLGGSCRRSDRLEAASGLLLADDDHQTSHSHFAKHPGLDFGH